ncbi:unnamed protein product [Adineta steineri]|uniref:Uncharacterized protein n=1 Tax=Adineta steineri TaxID=433720 RepID=A0A815KG65_9BILA|nr:unnamed protein product [Adineta steineri]CAF1393055.1 unnamed protein product [Adineta steineri]CAF1611708.1 unnamed protein product [Adineta steineri]CAF1611761.1 unnamed protein product [Adineta steineri]
MLSNATVANNHDSMAFIELLNTDEKLTFIRQLIQLINQLNYLKLQVEQWTYYYHVGITEGIWNGCVSKTMAMSNSIYHIYGRSKKLVQRRRIKYNQQLERLNLKINEYLQQVPFLVSDMDRIIMFITNLVHKDQYQLRIELERRRDIIKFHAKDHQLIQTFYNMKPKKAEICSAKLTWKAIHEERTLKYEMSIFKNWLSLKPFSTTYDFQDLELTNINGILSKLIFNQPTIDTRNLFESSTSDLSIQIFIEIEQKIRVCDEKIQFERKKLFNRRDKLKCKLFMNRIINTIEHRQINMIQHAQYHTNQMIRFIFGEITSDTK